MYNSIIAKENKMNPLLLSDEYLDLVDERDQVIGKKKRSEVYGLNLSNFRVINAFVVNSKGQLWIPRRSKIKKIFPLCLDMSVGGHVESGESYDEAFMRETQEELNLNINDVHWESIAYLTPQKDGVSAFMKIYLIKSDRTPQYNKNDFLEFFWILPDELAKRIKNGERVKSDLPKLLSAIFGV